MSKLALIALSIPLLLYSMNAHAQVEQTKLGILPPDYDYSKICKKDVLVTDNLKLKYADEKDITKLPEKNLVEFAKFYYRGDGIFPPDYDRARELVDYIIDNSQTKETLYRLNEALFIKYDMYLKGRGLPQNNAKAKEILDQLKKNGSSKAYSRYGDLYESEGQYDKAEASYKKAISLGESSKVFSLARLHYDKKIPTSENKFFSLILLL